MPLRRNRRQYEQLTDFDRGRIISLREAGWSNRRIGRHLGRSDIIARCWQSQKVECTVAEGQDVEHKYREDRAIIHFCTNNVEHRFNANFQTSSAIKKIRRRLTEVQEPTSAKTLTTDPTS
ncbi:hypothetical protein TNCV_2113791 [Trichonephila clavipes]|nr:hypothetical protein TNCV_2113791 [Trichonephila clavipes]